MKRSPMKRKTPMKRGTSSLARTSMKTGRNPIKAKRPTAAVRADHDDIREQVFARDGHRCLLEGLPGAGRCFGPLTPHHRRKAGQQGSYTVENLATLCAHHNDQLEADADLALLARTMGLVLKRGDVWSGQEQRFWRQVDRDGPVPAAAPQLGPCWLWRGKIGSGRAAGYGHFRLSPSGGSIGRLVQAHRFALSCIERLIPGMEVDHRCRVRSCVNPRHLEQVTPTENRRRQAAATPLSTHCRKGLHEYTPENTGRRSDGSRYCRACKKASRPQRKATQR